MARGEERSGGLYSKASAPDLPSIFKHGKRILWIHLVVGQLQELRINAKHRRVVELKRFADRRMNVLTCKELHLA